MTSKTSTENTIHKLSVLLISHYATYAMQDFLREFLGRRKAKYIKVVNIPLPELPLLKQIEISTIKNGKSISSNRVPTLISPPGISYFVHFFQILLILLFEKETFDIVIAQNSLLAIAGLVLKLQGTAKKVVFYSHGIDASRFSTSLRTKIYRKLDELAARYSDYNWVLGKTMREIRLRQGVPKDRLFWVPTAINLKQVKRMREPKTKKLIFIGVLNRMNGVMILPEVIKVLRKDINNIHLDIIGDGELRKILEKKVRKLNVTENITFLGVQSFADYNNVLTDYFLGLAPYEPNFRNLLERTDPMKLRLYTAAGLPGVVTKGFHFSEEQVSEDIGVAVGYNAKELAGEIEKLIKNKKRYDEMRKNCLEYSKSFDQDTLYKKVFAKILNG